MGHENARVIELCRRHCLRMEFPQTGGQGAAEDATGLPINMRQVRCPVAHGGMGMNLEPLVEEFYEEHCTGCELRRPTGDVPSLATVMEERRAAAAQDREAAGQGVQQQCEQWEQRVESRRSLRVAADPATANILDDIGLLDADPSAPSDQEAQDGARRRLAALAGRSPELFTDQVIDLATALVVDRNVVDLLTPLRILARGRAGVEPMVLDAAIAVLRRAPELQAGRCVADLTITQASAEQLDDRVIRALAYLAEPAQHRRSGRPGGAGDPSGLRGAADAVPERVTAALEGMLPRPDAPAGLILPQGTGAHAAARRTGEREGACCAAASAIAALAHTHPHTVVPLVPALFLSLGANIGDLYDREPLAGVRRALATMLLLNVGDVTAQLDSAGRGAGQDTRKSLFGVLETAGRMLDPDRRWPTPYDPAPDAGRQRAVFDQLMTTALNRVSGDWGGGTRREAGQLAESLAGDHPQWACEHLPAILGGILLTIEEREQSGGIVAASVLTSTEPTPPAMLALEQLEHRTALGSTTQFLLRALGHVAGADPGAVCSAVLATMHEERASQRGERVLRYLLPVLGEIGAQHGLDSAVLQTILPALHTYLVDAQASLRSAALAAWTEIGTAHPLPSSVSDLLPALMGDTYVVVMNSLLDAAVGLQWSEADRSRLLAYSLSICQNIDAHEYTAVLKRSMDALSVLAGDDEEARVAVDGIVLRRAAELDGYDLQDVLQRGWLPATRRSAAMAALRLRQACDPRLNDRFNVGDDEELCALLDCGPGLVDLPYADLEAAALDFAPEQPFAAAQFAEVAWRAGRPGDAASIMTAVMVATPETPAYQPRRALAHLLAAAADLDEALLHRGGAGQAVEELADAADALDQTVAEAADLARQARARITLRSLLADWTEPAGPRRAPQAPTTATGDQPGEPAAALRLRAQRLEEAASELKASSQQATATAAYLRSYADLATLGAKMLELDAAELDADHATSTALITAVRRRANLYAKDLRGRFDDQDPLAAPLLAAFQQAETTTDASTVADTLAAWAALPLPLPLTQGPRASSAGRSPAPAEPAPPPEVAVVLASIDEQLITGPQVLRPATVYELRLDVQPGQWPAWADALEADLLSHFTPAEAQTPTYTWPRLAGSAQETLSASETLILRFGLPAGRPAPPFLIRLRWRGTHNGQPVVEELDVAGHREIRLRPFDASRDYLTKYPIFDERLLTLYESLHAAGYDDAQLQAFCRLFTAICRTGLPMTWNKQYKRGTQVTERKFHDDLYAQLLTEPELGGRLERGSPLALGFLDVRHDGITAELKVERKTPVSKATAPKYMGQPTQYAAADGARLSILCILDMTQKASPVGVPENYLFTLTPALHGLSNPEAPSLVAVIVVNGNLPSPSSWSRRRTAVQSQP